MKKMILWVLIVLSGCAPEVKKTPKLFQNPMFNEVLYGTGNKNFSHDMRITPTSLTDYDSPEESVVCEYITEDAKGVLLKCKNEWLKEKYLLIFSRYKAVYNHGEDKWCKVWICPFRIEEGKIDEYYTHLSTVSSKVFTCANEKDSFRDFKNGPKIDCFDEIRARGWDKYITAKWE